MNMRNILLGAAVALALAVRADVYLVESNAGAASPYDTWETAAADWNTARGALASGGTLWISNGTYTASSGCGTIPANCTVCAVNGPAVTHLVVSGAGFGKVNSGVRIVGLHVRGTSDNSTSTVYLQYDSNIISNCVIDSCSQNQYCPVIATKGLIVDTVVTNCTGGSWDPKKDAPTSVRIGGTALMDRCRVLATPRCDDIRRGAVQIQGSGTLRNSLVSGNLLSGCCGVVVEGSGRVENCTIVGNLSSVSNTYCGVCALYLAGSGAMVSNTIVHSNVKLSCDGQGGTVGVLGSSGYEDRITTCFFDADGDPRFADTRLSDYRLLADSPCIDAGTLSAWMADAKDLDGDARLYNGKVDIGASEYFVPAETGARLYRTVLGPTYAPQTNEFTATFSPAGITVDATKCWWTFDGSEPSSENHQATGTTVTNDFAAGSATVRFRFEYGGETYGCDRTDWFTVKNGFVYVVPENPNAASPYATWETAATTFTAAFAVLGEDQTIVISNGTYALPSTAPVLPKNAGVRAVNGLGTVTFNSGAGFTMSNTGSFIDGLRLYNRAVTLSGYAAVKNCSFDTYTGTSAPALSASAGWAVDCVFTNCDGYSWYNNKGANAEITGSAVFDRCHFVDARTTAYPRHGVIAVSSGATLRNSVISGCRAMGCPGVYVGANGHVENCTIYANTSYGDTTSYSYGVYAADSTASIVNTIIYGNQNTAGDVIDDGGTASCYASCFVTADGDPRFEDAENDNFRLLPNSPCVDAGANADWMDAATDKGGNARIYNDTVDIGAYEYTIPSETGAVIFREIIGSSFAPQSNEFKVVFSPKGLVVDAAKCWWTFDGTEPSASHYQAVGTTVTNAFAAGTATVRFRFEYGGETYGCDRTDWFSVKNGYVYLVMENPNAQSPYVTWETAATSFADALAVLESGQTIVISNGTYALPSASVSLPDNTGVRAAFGPGTVTFNSGGFALSGLGCTIDGLRLLGLGGAKAAISLSNYSTVKNCILDGCKGESVPCLSASAGWITGCVFTNCHGYVNNADTGANAEISGGAVMDGCLFVDARVGTYPHTGVVKVKSGTSIRNTVVTGCRSMGCPGIYVEGGGKVENCTVYANTCYGPTNNYSYGVYASGASASVANTIIVGNRHTDGQTIDAGGTASAFTTCFLTSDGDPRFDDLAMRSHRLKPDSPCIDAGTNASWMDGGTDRDGNARIYNDTVDIGAYEYTVSSATGADVFREILGSVHAPQTNEFKVVFSPAGLAVDAAKCWWTFDGTEPSADNCQAVGTTVTNAFAAGTATVRVRFEYGGETYGCDKTGWFKVQNGCVYLVMENPNAQAPYATWATAATTFADAFAVLESGQTIVISNGTYALRSDATTLPDNTGVKAVNGPGTVTFNAGIGFNLSNLDCTLDGLRFYGTSEWFDTVRLSNFSTVRNCIFENCTGNSYVSGVRATAGWVTDCVFTNCAGYSWNESEPMNAYATTYAVFDRCKFFNTKEIAGKNHTGSICVSNGGVLRNSLVACCTARGCPGIYVGAKGVVENCTVVSNASYGTAQTYSYGVYAVANSTVVNTIVSDNVDPSGATADAAGTESVFDHCAVPGGFGTNTVSGDLKLKNAARGNGHLKAMSPCVNAGAVRPWMDGATDLDGKPRIQQKPDIGCYERARLSLRIDLR